MSDEIYRGTVRRVFFGNPETPAMAGVLEQEGGVGDIRFAGKCWAKVGDKIELHGEWTTHPKFGRQFNAHTGNVSMDESPEAMVMLLATHDSFTGLGPKRAERIVKEAIRFSKTGEAADGLMGHAAEIAEAAGVPLEIVENASRLWREDKERFATLALLAEQGWSSGQATKIQNKLGANAPALVRNDPYWLIGRIERFGFKTVDAVARKIGFGSTHPYRLCAGIAYCLDQLSSEGNTWTSREALLDAALKELRPDSLDGEDRIRDAMESMINDHLILVDRSPLDTEFICDTKLAQVEVDVFEQLLKGMADDSGAPFRLDGKAAANAVLALTDEQTAAVVGASTCRVSMIAGGAGVGKTHTMKALCDIAEANGMRIELCAPTGKAARKLSHATGRPASTIHRMLGCIYKDGVFQFCHNRSNPLEADLVICDEFSMVDVRLMHSLLNALPQPKIQGTGTDETKVRGCRLVIVGDHNQIPSVGPGAILRDLRAGGTKYPRAVNTLRKIHRQAGVLARNVTALLDGVVVREEEPCWNFLKFEKGYEESAAASVAQMVEAIVTSPEVLQPFDKMLSLAWDVQVLSPMRKGPTGTWALNVELQKLRQRLLGNPPPEPTPPDMPPKPMVGDKVIWTKNNYELELFNGTQATVQQLIKGGGYELFTEDGRLVEIPNSERNNVEVCYAMTIHKSQGSEWPMVMMVCSSKHWHMHDRNLLYTGASRASQSLMIVGDSSGIAHFAKETKSDQRRTLGSFMVHGWRPSFHYR